MAVDARAVRDGNVGEFDAVSEQHRRQKTMQVIEVGQAEEILPADELETASGVARPVLQHRRAQPVCQPRRYPPEQTVVADLSLSEHRQAGAGPPGKVAIVKRGDIRRIVLQVAVHEDEQILRGGAGTGKECGRLPEAPGMPDDAKRLHDIYLLRQEPERSVGAAVVHIDDLPDGD